MYCHISISRMRRQISMPSTMGIIQSSTTRRGGFSDCRMSHASCPFAAETTWNPASERTLIGEITGHDIVVGNEHLHSRPPRLSPQAVPDSSLSKLAGNGESCMLSRALEIASSKAVISRSSARCRLGEAIERRRLFQVPPARVPPGRLCRPPMADNDPFSL